MSSKVVAADTRSTYPAWIWPILVLPLLLIGWSVQLVVTVRQLQAEVVDDVRLIGRLDTLEAAIRQLGPGVRQTLPEDSWAALCAAYRGRIEDVRSDPAVTSATCDSLAHLDQLPPRLNDLRQRGQARPLTSAAQEQVAAEFQAVISGAIDDVKTSVRSARTRLAATSASLASMWDQLTAIVFVSCVIAVLAGVLLVKHRRASAAGRRSEESLRASEERFQQIAQNAKEWIWELDTTGVYTYASPAVEEILGYTADEIVGKKRFYDFFHPADRERLTHVAFAVFAEKKPFSEFINRNVAKNGDTVWLSTSGVPITDAQGRLVGYRGADTDITERRQAEEELRESEERFRLFTSAITDVVYRYDPAREHYDFISSSFETQTGYSLSELKSDPVGLVKRITHPDDCARVFDEVTAHIAAGPSAGPLHTEYRVIRKDGDLIWVEDTKNIEWTPDGGVHRINGVVRDVTARKRVERALRDSEERFRAIFESAKDSIFIKDKSLKYAQVNPAMEQLFGLPAAELVGKTDTDFFGADVAAHIRQTDARVLSGEQVEEEHPKRIGGALRTFHVIKVPMRDSSGAIVGLCGIARDVTDRVQADDEIRRHQESLAHASRLATIGEMASALAHELNQPLCAIANYAHACVRMLRAGEPNEQKLLEGMEKAASQAGRAGGVVNKIKNFVRKGEIVRRSADINHIVHDVAVLAAPLAMRHQATLLFDLAEHLPTVRVDTLQVEQVILNLVMNGLEAMEETPLADRELVIQTSTAENGAAHVTIRDNGRGLGPDVHGKVFEPFFSTKPGGMGMGLSISRSIVEAHEGKLWADANPERGTTLHFVLPAGQGGERDGDD